MTDIILKIVYLVVRTVIKQKEMPNVFAQISNLGRFKRVTSFHKNNKGEITVGSLDSRGYLRTNLTKEGKNKKYETTD